MGTAVGEHRVNLLLPPHCLLSHNSPPHTLSQSYPQVSSLPQSFACTHNSPRYFTISHTLSPSSEGWSSVLPHFYFPEFAVVSQSALFSPTVLCSFPQFPVSPRILCSLPSRFVTQKSLAPQYGQWLRICTRYPA